MPNIDLSILNQRQTPAFFADTLANRPAAGFLGRIFVSTDTFAFYRDNGTGWDLIGGPGTGTITGSGASGQVSFWNGASTITGNNNLFWDNVNGHLGIKTTTPDCALDVNHDGTFVAKFNNTAAGSTLIGIFDQDNPQWLFGTENVNDSFKFYDATNFPTVLERVTFKTNGQTFIGTEITSSGRLVVNDATGDNHIVVIGATAPSLRINNSGSGATKQIGIGLATATNNFIQGSADRDMAIFNGSTTPSPILFGIYDAGAGNTQEAARISAARNFLIGTTTDNGQKLQVNGDINASISFSVGSLATQSTFQLQILGNFNSGFYRDVTSGSRGYFINIGAKTASNTLIAGAQILGIVESGDANGSLGFYTRTSNSLTEKLTITSAGNVGIGSTTPTDPQSFGRALEISSSSFGAALYLKSSASSTYAWVGYDYTALQMIIAATGTNTGIRFETGSAERMRISNSGNLLIGTTTDNGNKLQVNGNTSLTGQLSAIQSVSTDYIATFQNTNANSYGVIIKSAASPNNAYPLLAVTDSGGFPYLRVDSGTGNVSIGTNPGANSPLRIAGLPTSPVGLASGEVWNNLGVLSIV